MQAARFLPTTLLLLALAPGSPLRLLVGAEPLASAQHITGKRLILKDGSWQIVTKWEVKGDRVRYYSAERAEWEEIPNSLIDWDATNKWNKEHEPGAQPPPTATTPATGPGAASADADQKDAAAIDAEAAAERAEQRARTPLVAPGLHLPDRDGIFVLDNFQSIPELVHLDQSTGNVNRDASHNVLRAAIGSFSGAKEPVRINGQAARVRLHVNDPALYVSLDTGNTEDVAPEDAMMVDTHGANSVQDKNQYSSPDSRYAIVRVDVHPGERVIGALRISRAGTATQSEDIVPTKAEILTGKHWMKLTPKEPLPIGEYALMEILAPGVINLDVWDFGISPNAPENRHPITPIKDSNQ
jgi:hypothetical protein